MMPGIIGDICNNGAYAVCVPNDAQKSRLSKGRRGGSLPRIDAEAYKANSVVERAINRLKDFRTIATRYDMQGYDFSAAVLMVAIVLWLLRDQSDTP